MIFRRNEIRKMEEKEKISLYSRREDYEIKKENVGMSCNSE